MATSSVRKSPSPRKCSTTGCFDAEQRFEEIRSIRRSLPLFLSRSTPGSESMRLSSTQSPSQRSPISRIRTNSQNHGAQKGQHARRHLFAVRKYFQNKIVEKSLSPFNSYSRDQD